MFKVGRKFRDSKSAHTQGEDSKAAEKALRLQIKRQTKQTQQAIDQLSHELEVLSKQLDAEVAKRKARQAALQEQQEN